MRKINALSIVMLVAASLFLVSGAFASQGSVQASDVNIAQFTVGNGHDTQIAQVTIVQTIINDGCRDKDGKDKDGSAPAAAKVVGLMHPDNPFGFQGCPDPIMNMDCSAWNLQLPCSIPMNTAS